jgi:ABC-2 type transport system permease protein
MEAAMFNLFLHELRSRRSAILGWGIGIALFGILIIMIFPDFEGQLEGFNIEEIELYQVMGNFGEFATFKGFVSAEMFTFMPILLGIYAIINGTGTLAGEEDSGTLEPLMSLPLHRWQLVATKALALGIALFLILAIVSIGEVIAFNALPSGTDVSGVEAVDLVVATLAIWPLIMVFATASMFLGAFMPSRRLAATVATILLIATYLANNLTEMVSWLETLKPLFPFNYYNGREILESGLNTGDLLTLLVASLLLFGLTLLSFQRRNVTVGAWPWQRAQIPSQAEA